MASTADRFGDDFGAERMWGLKELPYPDQIPFTPQTIGWAVVALLLLALLAWWGWRRWRHWQRNAYRREALMRLEAMTANFTALRELPLVLRKSALLAFRREEVASLRGRAWIAWLNRTAGRELFRGGDEDLIDRLPYVSDLESLIDKDSGGRLIEASTQWVRCHRARV